MDKTDADKHKFETELGALRDKINVILEQLVDPDLKRLKK